MNTDTHRYLELLEQRIALLGQLAESITAASTNLVSFDVGSLESRIAEQEKLCADVRALDSHIDRVQRQCKVHLAPSAAGIAADPETRRLQETGARLSKIQSTVRQLNDTHQMLLRRSRRTASALLNSYQSFAGTYGDPAVARASAGERQ